MKSITFSARCVLKSAVFSAKQLASMLQLTGNLVATEAGEPLSKRNPRSARLDHCVLKLSARGSGTTIDTALASLLELLGDLTNRIALLPENVAREIFVFVPHNGSRTGMLIDVSRDLINRLAELKVDLRLDIWLEESK